MRYDSEALDNLGGEAGLSTDRVDQHLSLSCFFDSCKTLASIGTEHSGRDSSLNPWKGDHPTSRKRTVEGVVDFFIVIGQSNLFTFLYASISKIPCTTVLHQYQVRLAKVFMKHRSSSVFVHCIYRNHKSISSIIIDAGKEGKGKATVPQSMELLLDLPGRNGFSN